MPPADDTHVLKVYGVCVQEYCEKEHKAIMSSKSAIIPSRDVVKVFDPRRIIGLLGG